MEKRLRTLKICSIGAAVAFVAVSGLAGAASAESNDAKIARAMSAAPADISTDATIMDVDGTILREGSNDWVVVCVCGSDGRQ